VKISRKLAFRSVGGAFVILLAAGIAAPFVGADSFGEQIRTAMERGLNRKVEIGKVTFNLFTGPGFTVENVIIYDDPSAGVEPFVHMLELEARVRLTSLLAGRIEFSRLRFVEASINIVKPSSGPWNVVALLQHTVATTAAGGDIANFPDIQVSGGRINFKFGQTKSPFYFMNSDVTVAPRASEKGAFLIRFSGEPARTDRSNQAFGQFNAAGRWLTGKGENRLEMDVGLEKGDIAGLSAFVRGQPLGVHGVITSGAKVYGPVSALQVIGSLQIDDVHRWDLMPGGSGGVRLNYRGSLDAASERLEIAANAKDNPGLPATARLIIDRVLSQPQWSADLSIDGMPASAVIAAARDMGAPIPDELAVSGNVVGVVGYGPTAGLQGQLSIDGARVKLGGGPELSVKHAGLAVAGDELRLAPASISGEGRSAELEVVFSPARSRFDATIRGRDLPLASLASGQLIATSASPLVERFRGGTWSGWVRYNSTPDRQNAWAASLDIRETSARIPGIATPLRIASASIELDGSNVTIRRLRASAGRIGLSGEYSYLAGGDRHQFDIHVPIVTAEDAEQIVMPALRHDAGLLARMRLTRPAPPEWLRRRKAEGSIHIGTFVAGETRIRSFHSRVNWSGTTVRFNDMSGRIDDGVLTGDASLDLSRAEPRYKLNGVLSNVTWRGGKIDLSGAISTFGTGSDLLLNFQSQGTFQARSLELIPEYPIQTVSGSYGFLITRSGPQVKLTALQALLGAERFSGQGATQTDGKLLLELASANRVMHVSGPVTPLKLEATTERAATHPR
jgi:hypothetical protein